MNKEITFIDHGNLEFKSCAEIRKIRGEKDYNTIDIGALEIALMVIILGITLPLIPKVHGLFESVILH